MSWRQCVIRAKLEIVFSRTFSKRNFAFSTVRLNEEQECSRVRISEINFSEIGLERIRNFSIIAHVDHGKSTLADRMLEYVGAISSSPANKQVRQLFLRS